MSEGFSNVACFSITTLLVVSLANMVLLIMMIMEMRKKCNGDSVVESNGSFQFGALQGTSRLSSLINPTSQQKFMAALVMLKGSSIMLICGVVIISKFWVLTAAHCCDLVKTQPFENLKISSNSGNWKKGKKHSVENLVMHINFTSKSHSFDLCLIKSGSPFKELNEQPAVLASTNYRYVTDTSAITLGWSSKKNNPSSNILYSINVNLISFQRCQTLVRNDRVDETMVCAYNIENNDCRFDSGGPLVQNNIVIGVASFEIDCTKRVTPRAFTRLSFFEQWFRVVEIQNGVTIGAVFRP